MHAPTKGRPALELPLEPESARTLGVPERREPLRARPQPDPEPERQEVEPETEPEELEPEQAEVLAEDPAPGVYSRDAWPAGEADDWRSLQAGAVAAMTAAAPNAGEGSVRSANPAWSPPPVQAPARPGAALGHAFATPFARAATVGPLRDPTPRTSVAPIVASLPPVETAPLLGPVSPGRLSADSKLLAAGGALAAAMLLVAVGVLLGQRSSSATAPSAATTVQYPVVVETKAPTATALPPAATAVEMLPSVSEHGAQKLEGPATINVQQLPAVPRPSTPSTPGWSVAAAAPKPAASAGWTVAAPRVRSPAAAAAGTAAPDPATGESPASAAASAVAANGDVAPAPSASVAPAVDPLVQAVREDIREDEARTK
jgi:hypothetical protein